MWITPDGTPNTVALPDPAEAMTDDFIESIECLNEADRDMLSNKLVDLQEELVELLNTPDEARPMAPAGEGLPESYIQGAFDSVEAISGYLNQIEIKWRLDAFLAVDDLLASYDEDDTLDPLFPIDEAQFGEGPFEHDDAYETVIDGQSWVARHRVATSAIYDFSQVSEAAEQYEFSIFFEDDLLHTADELDEEICRYLRDSDPETGFLRR